MTPSNTKEQQALHELQQLHEQTFEQLDPSGSSQENKEVAEPPVAAPPVEQAVKKQIPFHRRLKL